MEFCNLPDVLFVCRLEKFCYKTKALHLVPALIMPFAAISTTNTAIPLSPMAVTGSAFRYSGHAHASIISTVRAILHLVCNLQRV